MGENILFWSCLASHLHLTLILFSFFPTYTKVCRRYSLPSFAVPSYIDEMKINAFLICKHLHCSILPYQIFVARLILPLKMPFKNTLMVKSKSNECPELDHQNESSNFASCKPLDVFKSDLTPNRFLYLMVGLLLYHFTNFQNQKKSFD